MQEFLALFQYQNISEEIRGHFAQLDVCLRMFSVCSSSLSLNLLAPGSILTHPLYSSTQPTLRKCNGLVNSLLSSVLNFVNSRR